MHKRNNEKILEDLVLALELPPSVYEKAVKRYEHLGEWLGREESECSKNSPHVFPQRVFIILCHG